MVTYDGDDMVCVEPVLNLGEKMVILITHDERWEDGHATKRSSYQLFNAGANREGWLGTVRRRCTAGELHPGCDIVLSFDNSMTHHKKVDDALCAQILNLSDGGKNMGKPMPFQGW